MNLLHKLLNYSTRKLAPSQINKSTPHSKYEAYISKRRHSRRNRCIFLLNAVAGLRPIDIASLRICDVLTNCGDIRRQLLFYSDKRNQRKHRAIDLDYRTRTALRAYLLRRFGQKSLEPILLTDTTQALFVTQKCPTRGFSANTLGQYLHYLYKNTV